MGEGFAAGSFESMNTLAVIGGGSQSWGVAPRTEALHQEVSPMGAGACAPIGPTSTQVQHLRGMILYV